MDTEYGTRVVYERFRAGETVEELARDYDVPSEAIQNGIRWECLGQRTPPRFEPSLTDGLGKMVKIDGAQVLFNFWTTVAC